VVEMSQELIEQLNTVGLRFATLPAARPSRCIAATA